MEYITVRNIEKFHPGYKDRELKWAKIHCSMVQGDPDCELIEDEIDWARLIKIILLELEARKPLPNVDKYWLKKGFNLKKRPMSMTLKVLHNFLDVVTEDKELCVVDKIRLDKNRIDNIGEAVSNDLNKEKNKIIIDVITDLNTILSTNYKPTSKENRDLIMARLNKGATVEDFKKVHRIKFEEWGNDSKMSKYLRPITLYGSKFESYLNQKTPKPQDDYESYIVRK